MKEDIKEILVNTENFKTMPYEHLVFAMDVTRRILTNLLKEEERRTTHEDLNKPPV